MPNAANLTRINVAVYCRYSSDLQRDASLEDQLRICQHYVERADGAVVPELVFTDAAVSAASLQRDGFNAMMKLVREKKIDVIVTENLDRISRDFADSAVVFRELKYLDVQLVGVSNGFDSRSEHATVLLMLESWKNEQYLRDLSFKTKRGLEGRALKGFSTGGLPLGYTSVEERDLDGRVIGHRIVVDDAGSAVVRRIFQMYLDGKGYDAIAYQFNAEHISPPRKGKYRYKGWIGSSVREMLRNAAYIGEWTYGKKRWVKVPGTNSRRYRKAAPEQVIKRVYEDRRIIDHETWDAVQARLALVRSFYTETVEGKPKGRGLSGKRTFYPLSGLLRCGVCGTVMTISGGSSARYYNCAAAKKRGTCPNRRSLREDVARARIVGALRARYSSPAALTFLCTKVAEGLGEISRGLNAELNEKRGRLARTRQRITALIAFISDGDTSPSVRQTLRDLETQAASEQGAIDGLLESARAPVVLPRPEELVRREFELESILAGDPTRGRELLAHLFEEGTIRCTPNDEGIYVAQSRFFPLALLGLELRNAKPHSPFPVVGPSAGRSRGFEPSCSSLGCAGRI